VRQKLRGIHPQHSCARKALLQETDEIRTVFNEQQVMFIHASQEKRSCEGAGPRSQFNDRPVAGYDFPSYQASQCWAGRRYCGDAPWISEQRAEKLDEVNACCGVHKKLPRVRDAE
jgi:hypothetical protein